MHNVTLPTQAFSSLFRATELEERIEFWALQSATVSVTQAQGPAGTTTSVTVSGTIRF